MANSSKRPVVVVIVGMGRSGTTILESVLASRLGALGLGEVRLFWQRGVLADERCGCGDKASRCRLWGRVIERWDLAAASRQEARRARYDRLSRLFVVLARRTTPRKTEEAKYQKGLASIYEDVLLGAGVPLAIDSSKHPVHAALLCELSTVDVRVVHLVRDPRAVAYSWGQYKERTDADGRPPMRRFGPLRSGVEWILKNLGCVFLKWRYSEHYHFVTYEEFAADPDSVVEQVQDFLQLPDSTEDGMLHGIAGNPSRISRRELNVLEDKRWKKDMSPLDRLVVTIVALPLLLFFGYSLGSSRAERESR